MKANITKSVVQTQVTAFVRLVRRRNNPNKGTMSP